MLDLIDIGANLTHDSFDPDRNDIIQRAAEAGVKRLIVTGTSLEVSQQAVDLAKLYPKQLFSTVGVHPHHATNIGLDTLAALRQLALEKTVVAIGECGLDFFRDYSPRDEQLKGFEEQLRIATEINSICLKSRVASRIVSLATHRNSEITWTSDCISVSPAGSVTSEEPIHCGMLSNTCH
jgi:TatD DNase family protein